MEDGQVGMDIRNNNTTANLKTAGGALLGPGLHSCLDLIAIEARYIEVADPNTGQRPPCHVLTAHEPAGEQKHTCPHGSEQPAQHRARAAHAATESRRFSIRAGRLRHSAALLPFIRAGA